MGTTTEGLVKRVAQCLRDKEFTGLSHGDVTWKFGG